MAPTSVIPAADKTTTETQTSTSTRRVAQLTGHLASAKETEQVNTRPSLPIEYPVSRLQLDTSHCIDHVRELKVAVIGAGLAGINAGILLPAKVPGIKLTIFEKNSDVVSVLLSSSLQLLISLERHMAREYIPWCALRYSGTCISKYFLA